MAEDPTKIFADQSMVEKFNTEFEFDKLYLEEYKISEKVDAVLERAHAFVNMNFEPDIRENLDIFCSNERLNLDVYCHLYMLVFHQLVPYLWITVRTGQPQKISREDKIIILQLRQAILQDVAYNRAETYYRNSGGHGKWRGAMGAHASLIANVCDNPPDDYCMICQHEKLNEALSLTLECGHTFHKDCLDMMIEFTGCAICRQECRGPLPDISAEESGPWPEWLEAIAPFQRSRVQEELLEQPPPTDMRISDLEVAFRQAQERTASLYDEVVRWETNLRQASHLTESIEEDMHQNALDLSEIQWVELNSRIESIQETYRRYQQMLYNKRSDIIMSNFEHSRCIAEYNELPSDPSEELNQRLYRFKEWVAARALYYSQNRKQTIGEALESVYFNILSPQDTMALRDRRGEEGHVETKLREAVNQWRQSVHARDDAKDTWDLARYHKSLFEPSEPSESSEFDDFGESSESSK
ncbi:hypothetical protein BOTCAL_0138g00070 [Botryotinia calthae]|uniref:RING-type domain-containing protein n=1 Tax=Botryotinia calthae TaxID=38488 RepID=A0A4Y8D388_9HELO|nr:hypothetical protein BOTCAL_0138g00070 [Botryotinia calthae]